MCMKDELTRVPADRTATRFDNKVGYINQTPNESQIKKHMLERSFIDLVAGDSVMRERATARLSDLVGSTDQVVGEPQILLPRRFRQNRAWMELNKIWRSHRKVKGLIMKKKRGGFSVGIAGFLTFLPFRQSITRRDSRWRDSRFTVESINAKTGNITVF